MKIRTVALHSLGCKVNTYETDVMKQLLSDAGYQIVPFEEKAEVPSLPLGDTHNHAY